MRRFSTGKLLNVFKLLKQRQRVQCECVCLSGSAQLDRALRETERGDALLCSHLPSFALTVRQRGDEQAPLENTLRGCAYAPP